MNAACIGVQRAGRGIILAALLTAACGGERQAESGAAGAPADTAMVAPADASPMDTAAAATPDTAAPASDPAPSASADTAKPPVQTAQAEPAPKPAPGAQPKPAPKPAPAPEPAAEAEPATEPKPAAEPTAAEPKPAAEPEPAAEPTTEPETAAEPAAAPAADTQATQDTQPAAAPAAEETPAVAPLRDEYHRAPRDTVTQVVYDGWKQYNLNCARCHGEDVLGTTIAPHLLVSLKPDGPINTQEAFVQVVCAGRPEKGMPSWCALGMEMDKINAMYSYVKARSAGEMGPGRPALKEGS